MSAFPAPWGNYLLQGLVETNTPQSVSLWPQTIGWQLIALVLFGYSIRKSYLAWRTYKRNAYRREALAWINRLPDYTSIGEQPIFRQLPSLLRKTALQGFERQEVSPLSAESWESWLDEKCDKTSFSRECANHLHVLAYTRQPQLEPLQMKVLLNQMTLWITFHKAR